MLKFEPTGKILGAIVTGIDLGKIFAPGDFSAIVQALGRYGVLNFPRQQLDAPALREFSQRFGRLQGSVTGKYQVPGVPEVGYLSNVVENGEPIGLADAGQDWHTDMTYNATVGFANVLYAIKVPRRNGKALGATQFANMHAAYDELDPELKSAFAGRDRNPRLQQVLGEDASAARQQTAASDAGTARDAAAVSAPASSSRIRSRDARCFTAIPVTLCASTSSTRRKANACWKS